MERAKICEQEKLNFCERANKELCAEKARLEQLLKEAEEQREELWLELRTLREEKAETQEKFHQVTESMVHPRGQWAAWMREALPGGFCSGFVKGTCSSARGHKALLASFWKCVGGLQSCSTVLGVVLCFCRVFQSTCLCWPLFWLLISCEEIIVLSMNLSGWQNNQTVAKGSNSVALNPFSEKIPGLHVSVDAFCHEVGACP